MFIDYVVNKLGEKLKPGKGEFLIAECPDKTALIKPLTFVNLSGRAVIDLIEEYSIEDLSEMIIILDDVHLPFGKLRLRIKGGAGGHRGLESIIYALGTDEFPRLRIGVGPSPSPSLREFVLSPFERSEIEILPSIFKHALEGIRIYREGNILKAMQFINSWFYKREDKN